MPNNNCQLTDVRIAGVKTNVRKHPTYVEVGEQRLRLVLDKKGAEQPGTIHLKVLKSMGLSFKATVTSKSGEVLFEDTITPARAQGKVSRKSLPDYTKYSGAGAEIVALASSGLTAVESSSAIRSAVEKGEAFRALSAVLSVMSSKLLVDIPKGTARVDAMPREEVWHSIAVGMAVGLATGTLSREQVVSMSQRHRFLKRVPSSTNNAGFSRVSVLVAACNKNHREYLGKQMHYPLASVDRGVADIATLLDNTIPLSRYVQTETGGAVWDTMSDLLSTDRTAGHLASALVAAHTHIASGVDFERAVLYGTSGVYTAADVRELQTAASGDFSGLLRAGITPSTIKWAADHGVGRFDLVDFARAGVVSTAGIGYCLTNYLSPHDTLFYTRRANIASLSGMVALKKANIHPEEAQQYAAAGIREPEDMVLAKRDRLQPETAKMYLDGGLTLKELKRMRGWS